MQVRIQPVTTTTLNILGRSLKWSVAKCYKRSVDYFTLDTERFDFSTSCVRKDDIVPLKHKEVMHWDMTVLKYIISKFIHGKNPQENKRNNFCMSLGNSMFFYSQAK